MFQTVAQSLSC